MLLVPDVLPILKGKSTLCDTVCYFQEGFFYQIFWNSIRTFCPQEIGFDGVETNCGIAHILGILLMNSYEIQICLEVIFI